MPKIDWINQQGSAAWLKARQGIPTASNFHLVMTPEQMRLSTQRKAYACRLIAERLMNFQADDLSKIDHIAAGKENEPRAVKKLEMVFEVETRPVGFILTNDGRFGASPDRVGNVRSPDQVGSVIEVKCPTVPVQLQRLLFPEDESEYKCQRQGQLWIAEADKAFFFSYNPRMPDYFVEEGRDESFIRHLEVCLDQFSNELEVWTQRAKSLGAFEAFPELVPAVDATYGREMRSMPEYSEAEVAYILGET